MHDADHSGADTLVPKNAGDSSAPEESTGTHSSPDSLPEGTQTVPDKSETRKEIDPAEPERQPTGDLLPLLSGMEERILEAFERKLAFDASKEKQIDRLYEELQSYRSDIVAKAVRPVFQSLIRLHDDVGKVLEALDREDPAQVTIERLLGLLRGFREDVEMALDQNGVQTFRSEAEVFDPRRQRVLRTVETSEKEQVGRLAERVRPGFEHGETILEKERVAVYAIAQPKSVS